mmetsp:Transcript_19909/g.28325  ORF Transcript_19909/g.28325 Transcript_19909/m.28325 type:complete len:337 (-) Transcript_19909:158-1168(-)|eukprot:CAMPEP_0172427656 /NCGR_PEP_ID=MMETSP1064-20121228/42900_1 /TAXON_ID=202472 /ORGANISM="Aulacoseira subarctica , Strain CCAP 1002/5" /LENGTH=336 /DNA_ID=CAMNT_0013171965 /DNA_START=180 /DNA_END=1193 /DNA_ORIENTATION=-
MMEMITPVSPKKGGRVADDCVSKKLGADLVLEEEQDDDNDSLRTSSTTQDTTTAEGMMMYGYHLPIRQEREVTLNVGGEFRQQSSSRCSTCAKFGVLVVVTAFFIWIVVDSSDLEHAVEVFFQWVERNPGIGCVAFIGVCYLCTLLFLPVSILASGGGFVFAHSFGIWIGVLLATAAVFVGAGLGALTAFLSGRYLMRQTAQSLKEKYPMLEAIDSVLAEKGVRIIILLHLCPIIPFNVLNLIGGTSSMAAFTYAWTLLAILPGTVVYTFLGATASSLTLHQHQGTSASLWEIVSIVVGITLGTIGIATMSYYAKQELRKITLQREAIAALENELI